MAMADVKRLAGVIAALSTLWLSSASMWPLSILGLPDC
jgi:hypothetical protein